MQRSGIGQPDRSHKSISDYLFGDDSVDERASSEARSQLSNENVSDNPAETPSFHVQIGEGKFPLREHVSEKGNLTYVVAPREWPTNRGVRGFPMELETLGFDELPSSCVFAGYPISLEKERRRRAMPKSLVVNP